MNSELFTISGGEGRVMDGLKLVGMGALVVMMVVFAVYIMMAFYYTIKSYYTEGFRSKENLLYWGASTNSVRDDYGTISGKSLDELSYDTGRIAKAYNESIGAETQGVPAPAPVAATFVGARQNFKTEKMTPEEKLLQEQRKLQ